jgi:O-acetylserine/cysteine efflux transporter
MKPTDILIALAVVTIWGFNFVIKIGLQGLPPILFTALRFVFAALPSIPANPGMREFRRSILQ